MYAFQSARDVSEASPTNPHDFMSNNSVNERQDLQPSSASPSSQPLFRQHNFLPFFPFAVLGCGVGSGSPAWLGPIPQGAPTLFSAESGLTSPFPPVCTLLPDTVLRTRPFPANMDLPLLRYDDQSHPKRRLLLQRQCGTKLHDATTGCSNP